MTTRSVVDTNVIVSVLLSPSGSPARVIQRWESEAFDLLVSEPILVEYRRALKYDHLRAHHRMTAEEISQVIEGFREFGLLIDVSLDLDVIPEDPEDNKFIECAITGKANYIVTGDSHLLALQDYQGIRILTPAAFLSVLSENGIMS